MTSHRFVAGMLFILTLGLQAAAQSAPAVGEHPVEWFRQLTAQERWRVIAKAQIKPIWHTVARGEIVGRILERGTLEAVRNADVVCRINLRPRPPIIKWVVEDGALVKKGDKLIEFDDAWIREELKRQKIKVDDAKALHEQTGREREFSLRESQLAIREAEAEVVVARRNRKAYDGNDEVQITALDLKVERALVSLERARLMEQKRRLRTEADVRASAATLAAEEQRLNKLSEDLGHCVEHAPMDGFAVHYVPEAGRFGSKEPQALVGVGEPAREGQKLLRVCDVSRMAVHLRVHEAQIARVRKDAVAEVRVDAYPKELMQGKVASIATVASQADFLNKDVKVYPVAVHLEARSERLRPGMTAEVRLTTDRRTDVVIVPVSAVLGKGKRYCFVREDKDRLEVREIVTGASNEQSVEIRSGLQEGDEVIADPRTVLGKLRPATP